MPEIKPHQIDELIAQSKVQVVADPPKKEPPKPTNGMFKGQDGRPYWRYDVDGEVYVLPRPVEELKEDDYYKMPARLSDMAPGRLPQNLTVTFKDPQWAGYWFNKSAKSGLRVQQARAMGFIPCTEADVQAIVAGLDSTNGSIEQHDVVLMKIHKAKLFSRYAAQIADAKAKGGINSYKAKAESAVQQAGGDLTKGPFFHTEQAMKEFQGVGPVQDYPTVS